MSDDRDGTGAAGAGDPDSGSDDAPVTPAQWSRLMALSGLSGIDVAEDLTRGQAAHMIAHLEREYGDGAADG